MRSLIMRGASPSTKTLLQAMLAVAAALSLGTSGQDEATPYWGDGSGDAAVVTKQPDGTLETHRIRGRGLGSAGQYEATPYWGDGSGEPVVVTTGRPPGIGQPLPASHRIRGGPIPQPSLQPSTARFDGNVPPYYWRDHTAESPSSVIRAYQEAHPGVAVIPKRTPPADDVITTTVTSSGVTVITRRKPKDIPVVTGVYPQDPDSIAYGLRCVPVEGSHRVGQLTCATAASKPASRKGRERVALVVVGEVKAAMEEVVMDSAHLLVSPLRRDFGDDGVDVYLCVNTPYAVKFAPTWHYGGLIPAAVFEVRRTHRVQPFHHCAPRPSNCTYFNCRDAVRTAHGDKHGRPDAPVLERRHGACSCRWSLECRRQLQMGDTHPARRRVVSTAPLYRRVGH